MSIISKKSLVGSTAVMVVLSPLVVMQAQAAQLSMNAQAAVGSAVALTPNDPINFATLSETAGGGTVRIGFSDNLTPIGGSLNPVGGTPTSGNVTIKLQPGMQTKVLATTATFKITTLGGGAASKSMTVSNVTYRVGTKTGANLTFTPGAATNTLDIGADLRSAGGPRVLGAYSGSIKLMVTQP